MRAAREGHYWIFEHDHHTRGNGFYILRCPKTDCQSPVFSSDPLKKNRAVEHFGRCGVEFDDEEDIVGRYAKLVVPDRPTRQVVTRKWVDSVNAKLDSDDGDDDEGGDESGDNEGGDE